MTRSRFLPALALAVGLLTSVATSAQPPGVVPIPEPAPAGRAAPVADPGIPVLPKTAGAFLTLKVSALAEHPDMKTAIAQLAKHPDALAAITEVTGVSPLELDRVTLFWPRLRNAVAAPVLVVTTREPYNEARVLKALHAEPVFDSGERGGRGAHVIASPARKAPPVAKSAPSELIPPQNILQPKGAPAQEKNQDSCGPGADPGPVDPLFYALERGEFEALFLIDDRTLVFLPGGPDGHFATSALMAACLKKNATGPLAAAIAAAGKHTYAAGVHLSPLFRELDRNVPRELVPYGALFAARTAVVTGNLDKTATLNLTLAFDDAAAAKRAAPVLEEGIATVTELLAGAAGELKESRRPFEKSMAPLVTLAGAALKKAAVKPEGAQVVAVTDIDAGAVAAKALGEMVRAVQDRKKAAARMNNLKPIGLALHAYHDAHARFPANVYGPKGEPLLSWRVQLLPYLEENELFTQFKMDEPWDGPTNRKLIEKMPKVFTAPDRDHEKGQTFYQGFVAPDPAKVQPAKGAFGRPWLRAGEKTGISIVNITDGTSNTLAVIEAGQAVVWSKPDDLPFGGPVPPLGDKGWDRTPALRFDGSALLFPTTLKPDQFWPYVTIDGGEVTPDPEDDRRQRVGPPTVGAAGERLPKNSGRSNTDAGEIRMRDVRDMEARVSELTDALRAADAEAERAAVAAKRTEELFRAGAATKEAYTMLEAAADSARAAAAAKAAELDAVRVRLDAAKAALGEATKRRPK